ncbi:MAG: S1 family peptidase, partial [Dongiaceae bacterium]
MTTYDDLVQMIARGQVPRAVDPRAVAANPAAPLVRGQSPEKSPTGFVESSGPPFSQQPNPEQRALDATVRLKVEDASGWGVGTGTIIDTHLDEASQQYEALVLTCGHLFKTTDGKGKIEVELFTAGAKSPVPGELLDYDEHLDVALVSIWPGAKVSPVPVAAASHVVRPQDEVFTVGCSSGQEPTVERSKIHAVNRYANRPNLTVGGRPAQGRSGGGLFNAAGELIGVCNADDPQDGEGIYAGLAAVHGQLDKFNLQALYQREETMPVSHEAPALDRLAGRSRRADEELSGPAPLPATADAPHVSAPLPAVVSGVERKELVCIFRNRDNPVAQSEVLVIDAASAELIQRILDEAQATGEARLAARQAE